MRTFYRLLSERSGVRLSPGARSTNTTVAPTEASSVAKQSAKPFGKCLARTIALLLLAAAFAYLAPVASQAAALDADRVESCSTRERADGARVTRVRWGSGQTDVRVNLTIKTRLFPGEREHLSSRGKVRTRIAECKARRNGTVVVRTVSRARFAFVPAAAPELMPVAPVVVEPERPAAVGRWTTPTTLYAPVSDDWQPDAVLAAWNAALPADRQVTRVFEPCTAGDRTCIDVEVMPMSQLAELYAAVNAAAWWLYDLELHQMQGCSIDLAAEVAVVERPGVLAHEMGHCLGLPHWEHSQSVMSSGAHAPMPAAVDLEWIADTYR